MGIQFGSLRYANGGVMFDNGQTRRQLLNGLAYPPEPLTSEAWDSIVAKNPDLPLADRRDHAEVARLALIERHGQETSLCACGCRERVRWPGRKYLAAGHSQRGADRKRGGAWRNCLNCGDMFYAVPQLAAHPKRGQHCSRRCKDALSRQRNIRTDFQRRLLAAQAASDLVPSTFWGSQGIGYSAIQGYLRLPDRHPRRRTAHRLAPILGMSVAEIEEMCDGFDLEGGRKHNPNPKHRKLSKQERAELSRRLKGRRLSAAHREGISQRQRLEMQDPAKKAALIANLTGLKPLEPRIKFLATRHGADFVRSNLDRYTERYAAEFSLGAPTVRSIILRTIGDPVPPRAGKLLKGSKADIIRSFAADGKTMSQIVQEGTRRELEGTGGWTYKYAHKVIRQAQLAS